MTWVDVWHIFESVCVAIVAVLVLFVFGLGLAMCRENARARRVDAEEARRRRLEQFARATANQRWVDLTFRRIVADNDWEQETDR